MSAFQSYAGAYEVEGAHYSWCCYATARVYEVREEAQGPLPAAPDGKKWSRPIDSRSQRPSLSWLVDEATSEFSQILLQLAPESPAKERGDPTHAGHCTIRREATQCRRSR
jgi:hypothetical protein